MEILLVGIGGAAGSITRYGLGKLIARRSGAGFPFGTFIINISGALLLGFFSGFDVSANIRLLFADGFLGAYTTFSTFMYEGFSLFHDNEKKNAFVYIISTLILGIAGFMAGLALSGLLR
jgi:CrcB protein